MSDSDSSFGKWVGGILATIITGVVIWWLTGPLSPFTSHNQESQSSAATPATVAPSTVTAPVTSTGTSRPEAQGQVQPDVVISNFVVKTPIAIGETTSSDFELTNRGNGKATGCQLIWNVPGPNGAKSSEQFDLEPGEKKAFNLVNNHQFDKEGTYSTTASVSCGNMSAKEEQRPVVVEFRMVRHNF
jgi:hypothetical protein